MNVEGKLAIESLCTLCAKLFVIYCRASWRVTHRLWQMRLSKMQYRVTLKFFLNLRGWWRWCSQAPVLNMISEKCSEITLKSALGMYSEVSYVLVLLSSTWYVGLCLFDLS